MLDGISCILGLILNKPEVHCCCLSCQTQRACAVLKTAVGIALSTPSQMRFMQNFIAPTLGIGSRQPQRAAESL